MASSSTHDFFFQEANTLYFVHSLISRAWRHQGVTHVPLVTRLIRDVLIKKVDVDLYRACCSWLLGCEGSGATFRGLRMRSRFMRKLAPRHAGDLVSRLAVCACAYDPIHVTAQGKRLGPIAHAFNYQALLSIKLCKQCGFNSCVRVFFIFMGHVSNHAHIWAFVTSISHMGQMRDSDWSRQNLLRSDWLLPSVASMTTCKSEIWRAKFSKVDYYFFSQKVPITSFFKGLFSC